MRTSLNQNLTNFPQEDENIKRYLESGSSRNVWKDPKKIVKTKGAVIVKEVEELTLIR